MLVGSEASWLDRFHAGDRAVLAECYREHYATVDRAVGRVLRGADKETAIHEVFYRLISRQDLRKSFQGGSLGAWLATIGKNLALDVVRRAHREEPMSPERAAELSETEASFEPRLEAQQLVDRFRRELLPAEWAPVFEARFLKQLSQREAAAELGLMRTTLAYRELRIRKMLQRFLLREAR